MIRTLTGRTRPVPVMRTRIRPGELAQVTHAGALPNQPVSQPDSEKLDPSVRAGPSVVPVVATMRAATSHFFKAGYVRFGSDQTGK